MRKVVMMSQPSNAEAHDLCKVGQGEHCCRYLTMSVRGWSCEKLTALGRLIDMRVAKGEVSARGDNCLGKGSMSNPNAALPLFDEWREAGDKES